jgi:hypothetical protein
MTTFKANTTNQFYQIAKVNKFNLDRINPSLLFETPANFKKKLDNYLNDNQNLYNNLNQEDAEIKLRPHSVSVQKSNYGYSNTSYNSNFLIIILSFWEKTPVWY